MTDYTIGGQYVVNKEWGTVGGKGTMDWEDNGPQTTEWEDQLVKHKIISKRTRLKTVDQKNTEWREEQEQIDTMASKDLDEIDEMEDELDDRALLDYRKDRIAAMRRAQQK